jgi:hypothetical protein
LVYDDPTRPAEAPRAEGTLLLTLPEGPPLRLHLESEERHGEPSLLFPRAFRFTIAADPDSGETAAGEGLATLTLHTARRRGKQPARQTFTLVLEPAAGAVPGGRDGCPGDRDALPAA